LAPFSGGTLIAAAKKFMHWGPDPTPRKKGSTMHIYVMAVV